jgi:hypothetical protein
MTGFKNNATLLLREDWPLTADCAFSTVPTDKGVIVLGIRESYYPVQAAEFMSRPLLFSLATCGFESDRTLNWWTK